MVELVFEKREGYIIKRFSENPQSLRIFFSVNIVWAICLRGHHMVILKSQNKISDFFMILAWASPFKLWAKTWLRIQCITQKHATERWCVSLKVRYTINPK